MCGFLFLCFLVLMYCVFDVKQFVLVLWYRNVRTMTARMMLMMMMMMLMMALISQTEQVVANHCALHGSLTTTTRMQSVHFWHCLAFVVILVRQNVHRTSRMVVQIDPTVIPRRTATDGYATRQCSRIATPFESVPLGHAVLCQGSRLLVCASYGTG